MLHVLYEFLSSWHDVLFSLLALMIGELLREARCKRNWTIAEVAEKLGVDDTTVSRWERSRMVPSVRHLYQVTSLYEELQYLNDAIKDYERKACTSSIPRPVWSQTMIESNYARKELPHLCSKKILLEEKIRENKTLLL